MKTLCLHIGRGKTGTTALQRYLATHRESLLHAGVDYLLAGDQGRGVGHQAFAKSFIDTLPGFMIPPQAPEKIRAQTARQICESPAPVVLLSSENFPLANLDKLQAWIATLPVDVVTKVIFFVRSQDELAESEYNQMVKLKRESRTLQDYAATLEGADYDAECAAWAARFGAANIVARVYDGAAGDVIERFLSCLPVDGLPVDGLRGSVPAGMALTAPETHANRSLGARALATARLLNGIEIDARESLYSAVFAGFDAAGDLPAVLMSAAEARAYRARFAASNARFAAAYLGQDLGPDGDLGGRRYDDATRDRLHAEVRALGLLP